MLIFGKYFSKKNGRMREGVKINAGLPVSAITVFIIPVLILVMSLLLLTPVAALAQVAVCGDYTNLNVVVKDPAGSYVSGATVEIYKQEADSSGLIRATTRLTSGKTDSVSGTAKLKFKNSTASSAAYALKIRTINHDDAAFWFYNIYLGCGENVTVERTLSGILFILHGSDGQRLERTRFDIYSQRYDSSGNPVEEKKEKLSSITTDYSGEAKVYLPAGSVRGLGETAGDYYALELSHGGLKFNFFNIYVSDGRLSTFNYFLSSLRVKLEYSDGLSFPPGTEVEVFKQETDSSGYRQKGSKVGEFTLGADSYGTIEVPAGTYVLGVKKSDKSYHYFWSVIAREGQRADHVLNAQTTAAPVACTDKARLVITLRDANGNLIPGLKFEAYEQTADANGLPSAGKKIGSGTTDNSGQAEISFKPDTQKAYALKVWDKNDDVGVFWFFDAARFVCGYDRYVTKYLPALTVVLRDASGELKRNHNFSLYAQRYDFDQNPFFESKDLIANLKTDGGGQALVYVAPYNPYFPSQTGFYALSVKNEKNEVKKVYDIQIPAENNHVFQYNIPAPVLENNSSSSSSSSALVSSSSAVTPAATTLSGQSDAALTERLKGRILLQVESKGQAWYVNPVDEKRYYLGRPADAFDVMRRFGLGISNKDFSALLLNPNSWRHLAGRILLKTEDDGRAYYFDPVNLRVYYLGRPADAFNVMRERGLGISDTNIKKIGASD